jgi:hypothetical protein
VQDISYEPNMPMNDNLVEVKKVMDAVRTGN